MGYNKNSSRGRESLKEEGILMNFKRAQAFVSLFWLVVSIVIFVLDVKGIISLASNNYLFFGLIVAIFSSFFIVNSFEDRANKK